ncbi:ParB family chromosome partitioning protein [Humitalea rosea]|uniref:ParB family chromosome partitioning protein n=1 Tax=Humitalea rosea TaxID=990373 RepID=A0A2W7J6M7_9PROT|nr:ParB N-terminal domain-containing protein [Humitalea rosea]PZW46862.1 ParB family chromosome partitioning protein [Humitalea rosea]
MNVLSIPLADIEIGERLRPINPAFVELVAASMAERGQDTPIRVTAQPNGKYTLIAGAHRVVAALQLGWNTINAIPFEGDEHAAKLLEIDENLMRQELSALDRAAFLAERQRIYQLQHPPEKGGDRRSKKARDQSEARFALMRPGSFTRETAAKLGLSQRLIQMSIARVTGLAPGLRERLATHPVSQSGRDLDRLIELNQGLQTQVAEELLHPDRPAKTVNAALARLRGADAEVDPTEAQYARFLAIWDGPKTTTAAKQRIMDRVAADIRATLLAGRHAGKAGE